MLRRLEVCMRPELNDPVGHSLAQKIKENTGLAVKEARTVKVFTLAGLEEADCQKLLQGSVLHDPVLHSAQLTPYSFEADWVLEVGFRPGVTDNEARTARETASLVLPDKKGQFQVYTSIQYHLYGSISRDEAKRIATDLLCNELIQRFEIKSGEEWRQQAGFEAKAAKVHGSASDTVNIIPLSSMSDDELLSISRENTWALSLEEMLVIKNYYARQEVQEARAKNDLPQDPTDAEMEVLAQTWSEHCKHKIFAALIDYEDTEKAEKYQINSLYKTYIQGSTKEIRASLGKDDFCLSVFKDNAGVVRYADGINLCIKVETHNSPSALDPYGGALTGIVGVNRDPMGTGMGANLLCNTDVFCFASPFYNEELPPRLLHPRRVMEGVRLGVEDGGNKSGIPTVNGSIVFDERFLGKPLVFCGTVGMIPDQVAGKPGYTKKALPGDIIVMAGGRIGKDGIHGATFSSEELHEGSPATAVQIGDPITQRKLYDFIMIARDKGLYNAITDNGAGGLSSSVGEMAEDTGGCKMDLSRAPLKYDGLTPWEILLSEAQERMTLAVPSEKIDEFLELAQTMNVEATALGQFTNSGYFHTTYGDKTVTWLSMEFMHEGLPQMQLKAVWKAPAVDNSTRLNVADAKQGELLKEMLGSINICSREYLIRQYDHEVKGGSAVKPLVGVKRDGPGDAAVMRPVLGRNEALVLSHGICPKFSDYDTYWMMANAVDEAVRNAIAVGADPSRMAGIDNFCWCDPVQSEKTPDGHYKLAQLVRANQALADFCKAYSVPCISGKDSMKNDYSGGGVKISIPPTVLFSLLGFMPDVNKAQTSDFKQAGDAIYLLGSTYNELAGSELATHLGKKGGCVPRVDATSALKRYHTVYAAIGKGLINACHDLSDGGLAVAAAEMALAGRLGASLDISKMQIEDELSATERLYSESASRLLVTVPKDKTAAFEAAFAGQSFACLGSVNETGRLTVQNGTSSLVSEGVEELATAFKATFNW